MSSGKVEVQGLINPPPWDPPHNARQDHTPSRRGAPQLPNARGHSIAHYPAKDMEDGRENG